MHSSDPNFAGMTTNERLFTAGLMDAFDSAIEARDRDSAIELLGQVDLANQADFIVDTVLGNPSFYGYPQTKG
jgi:hypothetical protein